MNFSFRKPVLVVSLVVKRLGFWCDKITNLLDCAFFTTVSSALRNTKDDCEATSQDSGGSC